MSGTQNTLSSIQKLQQMEKDIVNEFPTQTQQLQARSLLKMEELTAIRVKMFDSLKSSYVRNITEATDDLENQLGTLRIVEDELHTAKKQLNILENQRENKMRMVEINQYYSSKYEAYIDLIKMIIMFLIPIGLLMYLGNINIIPEKYVSKENSGDIFLVLLLVVSFIAIFFILRKAYDIKSRDNMNFDEYNFNLTAKIDEDINRAVAEQKLKNAENVLSGCHKLRSPDPNTKGTLSGTWISGSIATSAPIAHNSIPGLYIYAIHEGPYTKMVGLQYGSGDPKHVDGRAIERIVSFDSDDISNAWNQATITGITNSEYDLTLTVNGKPPVNYHCDVDGSQVGSSGMQQLANAMHLGCVDQNCCADGTIYDTIKKRCLPNYLNHQQNNANASLSQNSFSTPNSEISTMNASSAEPFSTLNVPFSSF